MSQEVATQAPAGVPDLYRPPTQDIGADDISLPRLYSGQYSSEAVKKQRVAAGSLFVAADKDDPDPIELWKQDADGGVVAYVLALKKGKSVSEAGELVLFDYNDPAAPEEAWVTYQYTVLIPEYDVDVPVKLLLTRTSTPAAKKINTILKKNEASGPAYEQAFRLTAVHRENTKGEYFIFQVAPVDADREHVAIAEKLAVQLSAQSSTPQASGEQPAI